MEKVEEIKGKAHILFHRPTPWDADIQCSTKVYARKFAERGYRVTYLQSPVHFLHILLRKGYYHTFKKGCRMEQGIWVMAWFSWIPYLDSIPFLRRFLTHWSYRSAASALRRSVKRSGYGQPEIIWTTVPGSTALKKVFPKARIVFHSIDSYSAYRGKAIHKVEQKDYSNADEVFVIGEALAGQIREIHGIAAHKITNLGQGVEHQAYVGEEIHPAATSANRPKAVWVGLGKKLDRELLTLTSERIGKEGGEVLIAGPSCDWLDELAARFEHVHLLGPIHYTDVPSLLKQCDIGLMLYDRSRAEIYEAQHPLKLYEYAAAGLAVISTPHKEYDHLQPPVQLVSDPASLEQGMGQLLTELESSKQKMYAFGQRYSWDRCVDIAIAQLNSNG